VHESPSGLFTRNHRTRHFSSTAGGRTCSIWRSPSAISIAESRGHCRSTGTEDDPLYRDRGGYSTVPTQSRTPRSLKPCPAAAPRPAPTRSAR
jgi:hypothetical protein